jgi:hypothetical protein
MKIISLGIQPKTATIIQTHRHNTTIAFVKIDSCTHKVQIIAVKVKEITLK